MAAGCQHLEEALQLLQSAGGATLAPQLYRNINEGLASLRSQCALEDVAGPILHETKDARKKAVRAIREMLRAADTAVAVSTSSSTGGSSSSSGAAVVGPETVQQLLQHLTCEEVVHLQEWEALAKHPAQHKW